MPSIWYQQRMAVEKNEEAKAIMEDAQGEEFKHFGMDLEFLLRRTPKRRNFKGILFQNGDIVSAAKRPKRRTIRDSCSHAPHLHWLSNGRCARLRIVQTKRASNRTF